MHYIIYIYIYRVLIYWPQIYPHVLSNLLYVHSMYSCIHVIYLYRDFLYTLTES